MKQGRIKERKVDPVAELQPNTLQAPLIKPQLSHSYYVHKNKNYFMDWNLIVTISHFCTYYPLFHNFLADSLDCLEVHLYL